MCHFWVLWTTFFTYDLALTGLINLGAAATLETVCLAATLLEARTEVVSLKTLVAAYLVC